MKLVDDDIIFNSLAIMDSRGKVFLWNGQIYRAITSEQVSLYQNMFMQGLIEKLIKKDLLVDTEISSLHLEGYELILRHRTIPFVSYPHEWCDAMLKDAALLQIDLVIELDRYGLTSKDAVPLNVLFDGAKPIFVDFCSMVPIDEKTRWSGITYNNFLCQFVYPLQIMSRGYGNLARALMRDNYYNHNPSHTQSDILKLELEVFAQDSTLNSIFFKKSKDAFQFIRHSIPIAIRPIVKKFFFLFKDFALSKEKTSHSSLLKQIRQKVEDISLPTSKVMSYNCYDNFYSSFLPSTDWTIKQETIYKILTTVKPESVLDVDCDRGWYAELAARCGSQTIALDDNEDCVKQLYFNAKKNNLYIIPLLLDFTSPVFNFSNEYFTSVSERLRCDMVLGLTLFLHLLLKCHIDLKRALNRLSNLSNRWVLIEFISREDLLDFIPPYNQFLIARWKESPWYTLDQFITILKAEFKDVQCLPSHGERVLLLCEK